MAERADYRLTATCTGKQAFDTYEKGFRAAKRIRKFNRQRGPIALYRCSFCPAWHIGSKPRGNKSK